jgi:hypothetical protein
MLRGAAKDFPGTGHLSLAGWRRWVGLLGLALLVRLIYAAMGVPDYWGDAYHNWLIERLTLENGWVYTDYKGREVVWLPLFRYLGAATMALLGRGDMLPGRLVSLLAGVAACGVTGWAAMRWLGSLRWGLLAGLLLALNPWNVAYSWMNMPESVGTLLVAGVLLSLGRRGGWLWLVPLGFLGVLTRNDVTTVMGLMVGALLLTRRKREGLALGLGLILGMGAWSLWCEFATGDSFWWLTRRMAGSSGDAEFWVSRGVRPATTPLTLPSTVLQASPWFLVFAAAGLSGLGDAGWRAKFVRWKGPLLLMVSLGMLIAVGVMQLGFFSYPDPRYLVVLTPVLALLTTMALAADPPGKARAWNWVLGVVVVSSLAAQIPTFPFRAYSIEGDRQAGFAVSAAVPQEGALWVDAPVAIYHAGMDPARVLSSDQLVPYSVPAGPAARKRGRQAILDRDVRLIYYTEVPYSRVHELWPEMTAGEPFSDGEITFTPVARYRPYRWEDDDDAGFLSKVRSRIEGKYGPVIFWLVQES